MNHCSFICFDFGLKYIGVAVGSSLTCSATPLGSVQVKSGEVDWSKVDFFVKEWLPNAFVVGLPLHIDGSPQSFHPQLIHFKKALAARYNKDVFWADERLTTVAAKEELFEAGGRKNLTKEKIDATSAKIILEQWLFEQENKKND